MTKLRELARDECCTIRLPGCPNATETTVLAHFRMADICGGALKPPDECGAFADDYCHSRVDGRVKCDIPRETLRLYHLEGVMRTLARLHRLGYSMQPTKPHSKRSV